MMIYLKEIEIIIPIIISIALLTLAERKIMGSIQRRIGPNIVGIYGLLQPIIDGIKLLLKESITPVKSNSVFYILAPLLILFISLLLWIVIPFRLGIIIMDIDLSVLFIFAISTLTIYGVLYGGWASNSKYGFIGGLRATSQLISYEVSIGIILISIISISKSFNLNDMIISQINMPNIIPLLPIFIILLISLLAETNRTPFDLLEAESELVAGFIVEYSSIIFAAFYLGEYSMILLWSHILSLLFFGTINYFSLIIMFIIIWIRASLPRLRYDQLLYLGWSIILPFSISYYLFILSFLYLFD